MSNEVGMRRAAVQRMRSFERRGVERVVTLAVYALAAILSQQQALAADGLDASADVVAALQQDLARDVAPVVTQYCVDCHSGEAPEAEIDLAALSSEAWQSDVHAWQRVEQALKQGLMPPADAEPLGPDEHAAILKWIKRLLALEAAKYAGDPGPVVLRRLNNVEYTNTIRALTGVATLDPVREFPPDSAAGEGFTNVGSALAMSPALAAKYYDAAKHVAAHAVFTPTGIRFLEGETRRDFTGEYIRRIRDFYAQFIEVNPDWQAAHPNAAHKSRAGLLPLLRYVEATIVERDALQSGAKSVDVVAQSRGLNAKYLGNLWAQLNPASDDDAANANYLLGDIRSMWQSATPDQARAVVDRIQAWQHVLWQFNSIGRMGPDGIVKRWQTPVVPIVDRHELRLPLPPTEDLDSTLTVFLAASSPDGAASPVVWERPRLVRPGRSDILLRDAWRLDELYRSEREAIFAHTAAYLRTVDGAYISAAGTKPPDYDALAKEAELSPIALAAWRDVLGETAGSLAPIGERIADNITMVAQLGFVEGWLTPDGASVFANSSDETARTPATYPAKSVVVHPSPSRKVLVAWRCPEDMTVRTSALVQDSHPGCGNGVLWSLEFRRGRTKHVLWAGTTNGDAIAKYDDPEKLRLRRGDALVLAVAPRDGDHSCDSTLVEFTIRSDDREWDLTEETVPNVCEENPRTDAYGNREVWHFTTESTGERSITPIPHESLLARWQLAPNRAARGRLAQRIHRLLAAKEAPSGESPDAELRKILRADDEALLANLLTHAAPAAAKRQQGAEAALGFDLAKFGRTPSGESIDGESIGAAAGETLEVRLPASIAAGSTFAVEGTLAPNAPTTAAVQFQAQADRPQSASPLPQSPFVACSESDARRQLEAMFDAYRGLFPIALCYEQIVPVDEVITMLLYFREDEELCRLMLDDAQKAELDRLWDELFFVSREPEESLTAFDQMLEYATQLDPRRAHRLRPLLKQFRARVGAFHERMTAAEPVQLESVIDWAEHAYRRPRAVEDRDELRRLYSTLRAEDLPHEDALRLVLARVLVSPNFLYRIEQIPEGGVAASVSDYELANRLSYFLWSSPPDEELLRLAAEGKLRDSATLASQARRMLADVRVRNLAEEFGCQWLHIHDFDALDEKSERHFPTFASVKGLMYEEAILFLTDLFQSDQSVINLIDADYAFLNEQLAAHYGVPGVTGPEWRKVEGVQEHGRGGILALGATLAKQSGASRTSPILRGNWLTGVVLDDKLPPPPKNVPPLDDEVPEGLTERQLTERHARDPACSSCHQRIDPFGFALEHYDAIGRRRDADAAGLAIDARTTLPDGTEVAGLDDLRRYLVDNRRDEVVRQFSRKLLGYALGRSTQLSDEPLLDEIDAGLKANEYKSSTVVERIVLSRQFREIRGADPEEGAHATAAVSPTAINLTGR